VGREKAIYTLVKGGMQNGQTQESRMLKSYEVMR
jgi:hypothetical protein